MSDIIDVERGIDERKATEILDEVMNTEKTCQYLFTVCCSGFSALDIMRSTKFDLLIVQDTDLDMCGDTLMRVVRNLGYSMPAILLCAKDDAKTLLPKSVLVQLEQEHGLSGLTKFARARANGPSVPPDTQDSGLPSPPNNDSAATSSTSGSDDGNPLNKVLIKYSQQRGYASILLYPFTPVELEKAIEIAKIYSESDVAKQAIARFVGAPCPPPLHSDTSATTTTTGVVPSTATDIQSSSNKRAVKPHMDTSIVHSSNSSIDATANNKTITELRARITKLENQNNEIIGQTNQLCKGYTRVIMDITNKYNELQTRLNLTECSRNLAKSLLKHENNSDD